jgi:hypothetical protein
MGSKVTYDKDVRPDVIVKNKGHKTCLLTDVSIPSDRT